MPNKLLSINEAGEYVAGDDLAGSNPTFNSITVLNNLLIDCVGSSASAPRIVGLSNLLEGTAARVQFGDQFNCFQTNFGGRLQVTGYHGLEFYGANAGMLPAWTAGGSGSDYNVSVVGLYDSAKLLKVQGTPNATGQAIEVARGGSSVFRVNALGGFYSDASSHINGTLQLKPHAIAGLPSASAAAGMIAYVNDGLSPIAVSNGSSWINLEAQGETPDLYFEVKDHYICGGIAAASPIGHLGLIPFVSGTGASIGTANGTQSNPGVVSITTGTTTTGHGIFRSNISALAFGTALYKFKWISRITALPAVTEAYDIRVGFGDAGNGSAAIVDGCFFHANQANANWLVKTSANSAVTTTITNVLVTTNFTTFEIIVNKTGTSVAFYINNVLVATHTTNIPVGAGRETGINLAINKTAGITSRDLQLDYTDLFIDYR